MPGKEVEFLDPEDILSAEYTYIAETASQANEDRTSVISFFLIAVGSPLAAFFSTELIGSNLQDYNFSLLFSGLFFILSVLGTTTILQLARLRAAWYESMLAMDRIKEFIIEHSDLDIRGAFLWRATTAPKRFKINSISFYQALEVAILSGLLFGAFVFFLIHSFPSVPAENFVLLVSLIFAILNGWFQLYIYKRFLD